MRKLAILICLAALALAGCTSKVTGALEVDGSPFEVKECRSGQAFGFPGIELTDAGGRRLRLLANADGTCSAALFKGDSATGDRLGECGTLTVQAQSSRINSITNVMGKAQLACEAGGHKVSGSIEFENCH
ncbi:MAG TPA: hypothetical protein VN256_00735 [Pyrinomonadaceae bacterium]|nr:hypothetical protein [Pyrinomonadaceae bacterium]